jgi:hypothetical protein
VFIKVEPTDFFMYLVKLIFDLDHPDSEDQQVRDYLNEHELEPKYQGTGELEGSRCEVMQFGGCYLGRHLEQIGRIQRHAVEVELLTAQIQQHLNGEHPNAVSLPEEQRQAVIAALVQQFHQDSSFKTGENGELIASLDDRAVRAVAQGLLSVTPGS